MYCRQKKSYARREQPCPSGEFIYHFGEIIKSCKKLCALRYPLFERIRVAGRPIRLWRIRPAFLLSEPLQDFARHVETDACGFGDIFGVLTGDFARAAIFLHEARLALWPDAVDIVEFIVQPRVIAFFSVKSDGACVGFVPDMGHEQDFVAALVQDEGFWFIGVIEAFRGMLDRFLGVGIGLHSGFSDAHNVKSAEHSRGFDGIAYGVHLSVSAVDEQEIRHFAETTFVRADVVFVGVLDEVAQSSREDFVEASEVVLSRGGVYFEGSASRGIEPSLDKDDHGGDDLFSLHV